MISQKELAKRLGISQTTVSGILGGVRTEMFRPELREKVLRGAEEYGYVRNVSASAVRTGTNRSTVAIVGSSRNLYTQELLFLLTRYLNKRQLVPRCYVDGDIEKTFLEIAANQIPYVINNLSSLSERKKSAECARKHRMKMAFICPVREFPDFPAFDQDTAGIMRKMIRYLHGFGHERILLHCARHKVHSTAECLHRGYREGLEACALPREPGLAVCGEFDDARFWSLLEKFRPTAIVSVSPTLSVRIALSLERRGVEIPHDLSLLSFGTLPMLENFPKTPVTSTIGDEMKRFDDIFRYFHGERTAADGEFYSRFYDHRIVERQSVARPDTAWKPRPKKARNQ